MEDALYRFEKRCNTVRRKHEQLAQGYVTRLNRQGVIVREPCHRQLNAVFRAAGVVFITVLFLKALLIAGLGPERYEQNHAELRRGTTVERAGAVVMDMGPVSTRIASLIAPHMP